MAESEARDWVIFWVEDLHRLVGSWRFWKEEQERIDLGTCCFTRFEKQIESAVKQCFSAAGPRIVYSTNELLSPIHSYCLLY